MPSNPFSENLSRARFGRRRWRGHLRVVSAAIQDRARVAVGDDDDLRVKRVGAVCADHDDDVALFQILERAERRLVTAEIHEGGLVVRGDLVVPRARPNIDRPALGRYDCRQQDIAHVVIGWQVEQERGSRVRVSAIIHDHAITDANIGDLRVGLAGHDDERACVCLHLLSLSSREAQGERAVFVFGDDAAGQIGES